MCRYYETTQEVTELLEATPDFHDWFDNNHILAEIEGICVMTVDEWYNDFADTFLYEQHNKHDMPYTLLEQSIDLNMLASLCSHYEDSGRAFYYQENTQTVYECAY